MFLSRKMLSGILGIALSANAVASNDSDDNDFDADYIIVGLGTAGAVAARYLSDANIHGQYKNSVLVLEAGENYSQDPTITAGINQYFPLASELWFNPKYSVTTVAPDSLQLTSTGPGLLPFLIFSHGRGWFGSSSHYGMTAVRGSSNFYDRLATQSGDSQWSYSNLLPYMKFLENYDGIAVSEQPAERGTAGRLYTHLSGTPPATNYPNIISNVTGGPILRDHNTSDANTVVATEVQAYTSLDGNTRVWGYNFLPTAILNPDGTSVGDRKLKVKSGAYVNKVIFDDLKAVGVEFISRKGNTKTKYAKKGIILCAGAPFSSAVLERSGIGNPTILNDPKVGVNVLLNQPLVGEGLKDHYGVIYASTQSSDPANVSTQSVRYFVDGSPFYAPAGNGDNDRRIQALLFPFLNLLPKSLQVALGIPTQPTNAFIPTSGVQGFSWILQPKSSGSSHIVNRSPFIMPEMRFKPYTDGDLSDPSSDLSLAVAALKIVKQITDDAGGTMIYPPQASFASDNDIATAVGGAMSLSQYTWAVGHYAGTCHMGSDISNSVVSSHDLHVWGTKNLYVADNSVTQQPEDGNNGWTAYLFGLKMADILRGDVLSLTP